MAKKKKRSTKKTPSRPKHSLPDGFWPQVGAVVLVILAFLLVLGIMNTGGIFPVATQQVVSYLFGLVAYILPLLLVFRAVQVFQAEHNKIPVVVTVATVLFVLFVSGFAQLMSVNPSDISMSQAGKGGGVAGWLMGQAILTLVNAQVGALVYAFGMLISSLFVLSVSPRTVIDAVAVLFKREKSENLEHNREVAARAKDQENMRGIGDFKLIEGVPVVKTGGDDRRDRKLNGPKDNALLDKKPEEQVALTSRADLNWQPPSIELLEEKQSPADAGNITQNAKIIKDTFEEFGIGVQMEGANVGPKVTQYTLKPPSGVKLTKITQLENNLALKLEAQSLRVEAPIPGKSAVGIEVPNKKAADVRIRGILSSKQWKNSHEPLSFAVGKDISGNPVVGELNKMPHLLIAGQTNSGKSVMVNTLLCSLLYRNSPARMKLILVDPKQVEMARYDDIPHLLTPIITDPEKTVSALKWAVNEMENRYSLLKEHKQLNINDYNDSLRKTDQTHVSKESDEDEESDTNSEDGELPYIVIVIDEMSDLMSTAPRDVEGLIVRLAQKARAVGIHLVLATQSPRADVITGLIKANVPAKIAFTVTNQLESRIILDSSGAEKLLGSGDMLYKTVTMSKPARVQGAWVTNDEVTKITSYLRGQSKPQYNNDIINQPVQLNGRGGVVMDADTGSEDSMYNDAVRCVIENRKASTSLLQRRLRIGYGRASRIIEEMEEQGIIGPADGSRPREVLISSMSDISSEESDNTDEYGVPI